MRVELGCCSFCGQRREVVRMGEVPCGSESVEVLVCSDCTVECARAWELGRRRDVPDPLDG